MNKRLILIIALCVATLFLVAEGNIRYGVKAGLNIASIGISEGDAETDSRIDFALGGFMEYKMSPTFSIQPELLYTRKGYSEDNSFYEMDLSITYIQMPVLAKYIFAEKYGIFAGPAIGFLMTADQDLELKGGWDDWKGSEDVKEYYNSTEFALVFGADYDFNNIIFDVRYDLGLTKINDDDGDIDWTLSLIHI